MIGTWHQGLKSRMRDLQTVRDYMRSLTLYRADVIRAGTDLDDADKRRLADIATGWKWISLSGKAIGREAAEQRLTGLRSFYGLAEENGWINGNPIP